jgi:hypothetical protein
MRGNSDGESEVAFGSTAPLEYNKYLYDTKNSGELGNINLTDDIRFKVIMLLPVAVKLSRNLKLKSDLISKPNAVRRTSRRNPTWTDPRISPPS